MDELAAFAAQRAERLVTADREMRSLVATALASFGSDAWAAPIIEGAAVLWLEIFEREAPGAFADAQLKLFQTELDDALSKTADPGVPTPESAVDRITMWVGTFTVNNATYHAAAAGGYRQKQWVSMLDDAVRDTHRAVSGQIVAIGETFNVGGSKLHYPGEPVGDPANWINCRCLLRRTGNARVFDMAAPTQTAPAAPADGIREVTDASGVVDEGIEVAGLAVRALDTGRVLMLQRALDPEDPAGGKWEFPGGHIEPGETAYEAAVREWTEETGLTPPVEMSSAMWTANGMYQGFIVDVPLEYNLGDRAEGGNPDDPEGDEVEAIAWWTPTDLVDNPVVRDELASTLDDVFTALDAGNNPPNTAERFTQTVMEQYDATKGGTVTKNTTAVGATEAPVVDGGVEADVDQMVEIPFHGVAAPVGVRSGDGRQFGADPSAHDAVTHRELPLPMMYQKATSGDPHGGAVRVGRIDNIWVDEANLVQYTGFFNATPEAAQAIEGIIFGDTRSVSVDLGGLVLDRAASTPMDDFEARSSNTATDVFSLAEIAAITMVPVGAFSEAYIALGECDCAGAPQDHAELDGMGSLAASGILELLETAGIVDLTALDSDALEAYNAFDSTEGQRAWLLTEHPEAILASGQFAPGTKDGPGWITDPIPTARIRRYWTHGEGAAKIKWGVPGDFNRCRAQLAKYIQNPDWLAGACANMHKEALGVWPGGETGNERHEALIAAGSFSEPSFGLVAAGPLADLPRAWFENPQLEQVTLTTVTPEGRVYGHLAQWESCHIGVAGACTAPPASPSNYAFFHTGVLETDGGDVPVGHLTMGLGHIDIRASAAAATAHYDQSDAVVADVVVGEDAFGIWFSGALRPNLDDDKRREFRATGSLSGDWRKIGGQYELVGAVVVGVPGFPVPNLAIAASGGIQTALVAAGMVMRDAVDPVLEDKLGMVRATADEVIHLLDRRARVGALRDREAAIVRPARLARVQERL